MPVMSESFVVIVFVICCRMTWLGLSTALDDLVNATNVERTGATTDCRQADACYSRIQRWRIQPLKASTPSTNSSIARMSVLARASWNRLRLT